MAKCNLHGLWEGTKDIEVLGPSYEKGRCRVWKK